MIGRNILLSLALAGSLLPGLAHGQAAATGSAPVLATGEFSDDPDLRCDLLEVKRVSGGALMVRWRVVNTTGASGGGLTGSAGKTINYNFDWPELYYIDPAENKKYQFLTDSGGNRILNVAYGNFAAGTQRVNWAKFPAPPANSKKISLSIPRFAPFEDVPVSE
jgi:hypothetical protein